MKKILLFEPWHLGDVAVALSVIKPYRQAGHEFGLVCNKQWKEWALGTEMISSVIDFAPPWTYRKRREKYNPLNYKIGQIKKFRSQVLDYHPDRIVDLRGDIRANYFLKLLFGRKIKIIGSRLPDGANVYKRGEVLQKHLRKNPIPIITTHKGQPVKTIALFFGAADSNRMLPFKKALELITALSEQNFCLNLILEPNADMRSVEEIRRNLTINTVKFIQGNVSCIADKINHSDFVISTDSGWLHVAHFYSKPSIGLFGFDTMKTWLPPCSFCLTSDKLYPAEYRYQKRYRDLQPLSTLNINTALELVQSVSHPQVGQAEQIQTISNINA
jgi:ADP-heptose:LPS heptosyltransferase